MGRKTLYDANTFPLLSEKYAREGLNDKEIAKKLGISNSRYYVFQNENKEFKDAIKRGKAPVDVAVENALYKRAIGYSYEEKTTEVKINDDGTAKPAMIKTTTKKVPPDVGAIAFWLKNRNPKQWKDRHDYVEHKPTENDKIPAELEDLPDHILDQIADHLQGIDNPENKSVSPVEKAD